MFMEKFQRFILSYILRVFQLDAVERAARSFRSLAKRQEQASGMFYLILLCHLAEVAQDSILVHAKKPT